MALKSMLRFLKPGASEVTPKGLSEYIESTSRVCRHTAYLMRPTNERQAISMAYAYLSAFKDDWAGGGDIYVTKSTAPDILLQLSLMDLPHVVVVLPTTESIEEVVAFDNPRGLWVFIENDDLTAEARSERFSKIQLSLRKRLDKALACQNEINPVTKNDRAGTAFPKRLMFVGMGLPTEPGFDVMMSKMRSMGIGGCFIDSTNRHKRRVDRLYDLNSPSYDDVATFEANTIKVFGSGPRHSEDIARLYSQQLSHDASATYTEAEGSPYIHSEPVKIERVLKESDLGIAFGFGVAVVIDLDK